MLHLIKMWLECPVEETDDRGRKTRTTEARDKRRAWACNAAASLRLDCGGSGTQVLPDHLHVVWTLPPGDADFSTRWRLIKSHFAKALPKRERLSAVRIARNERGIWQRRFWEHLIRDEADYTRHVDYCYINPLKHHLVTRVRYWPHSSFHRDVRAGIVPLDWAGEVEQNGGLRLR